MPTRYDGPYILSCRWGVSFLTGPTPKASADRLRALLLEPVAGLKHPGDDRHAGRVDPQRDRGAGPDGHVGDRVEAPAEAADQVDDGVERRNRPPRRAERLDRIEGAAEEGQRGDHQHREYLQLLEILGPDADRETEQAKS